MKTPLADHLLDYLGEDPAPVVAHNLSPEHELEVVRHQMDELFVRYLDAYRRRKAAGR